jgi:hypothetical protein
MKKLLLMFVFLFSSSVFANTGIPGIKGPVINFVGGKLVVSLLLTQLELQGGLELQIPSTNSSYAGIEPNVLDGGSIFNLKLDVEDIKKALNVTVGEGNVLPCGRPIPGIPGGVLKDSIRIQLTDDQYGLTFYYHQKLFGTYIPFNFNFTGVSGSIRLDWKGKPVGTLVLVGKEGTKKAAAVIFLNISQIKENKEFMRAIEESRI